MGKVFGHIISYVITICISVFTASRLLHLLSIWLPHDQPLLPWLALAAFEIGMWGWVLYFRKSADGSVQRALSLIMIVVDFLAVGAATVGDFYLMAAEGGKVPAMNADTMTLLTVGIAGVFVLNAAAHIGCIMGSNKARHEWAQQDADDVLQTARFVAIREEAHAIAPQFAQAHRQQFSSGVWQQAQLPMPQNPYMLPSPATQTPPPPPTVEGSLAQVSHPIAPSAPQHSTPARRRGGFLAGVGNALGKAASFINPEIDNGPKLPSLSHQQIRELRESIEAKKQSAPTQPASQPAPAPAPARTPTRPRRRGFVPASKDRGSLRPGSGYQQRASGLIVPSSTRSQNL